MDCIGQAIRDTPNSGCVYICLHLWLCVYILRVMISKRCLLQIILSAIHPSTDHVDVAEVDRGLLLALPAGEEADAGHGGGHRPAQCGEGGPRHGLRRLHPRFMGVAGMGT